MKDFVVWLDSKNAHVFAMKTSGIEKSVVKKSDKNHHTRHKNDQHKDSNAEHYYQSLAKKLEGADHLLLIGPGLAKIHFKDHLSTHQANTLAKKIVGMENSESFEHQTENELLAMAHKFFKSYNLFNSPI